MFDHKYESAVEAVKVTVSPEQAAVAEALIVGVGAELTFTTVAVEVAEQLLLSVTVTV